MVDVLVLNEITDEAAAAVANSLSGRLPYHVGTTGSTVAGTRIYSRYPVTQLGIFHLGFDQVIALVETPQFGPAVVAGVHTVNPYGGVDAWSAQAEKAIAAVSAFKRDRPAVVAGDLNAVNAHSTMQRWRQAGFHDAVQDAGAGWQPTFPSDWRGSPVVAIDHVLTDDRLAARSVRTFAVPGSDHRGVLAQLGWVLPGSSRQQS